MRNGAGERNLQSETSKSANLVSDVAERGHRNHTCWLYMENMYRVPETSIHNIVEPKDIVSAVLCSLWEGAW